jgi:hypothetical protein
MRRHPGAGFALCHGDFDIRHQFRHLTALGDGIDPALERGKVEPFVRGDQIDRPRTSAGIEHAEIEQYVAICASLDRRGGLQIEVSLKHLSVPFLILCCCRPQSAAPVHLFKRPVIRPPFAGLLQRS